MGDRMLMERRAKGFTLLELMIVVVIVGILAAVVYPSYVENVREARRADAKEVLMRIAQAQERHFTQFGRYASGLTGAASATNLALAKVTSESGDSSVAISNTGVNTYTLTATITPADPDCGNLSLTQTGVKGESGSQNVAFCW
ncbi:MAG: type IV pilin protein [Pseudomonadales bacterium]